MITLTILLAAIIIGIILVCAVALPIGGAILTVLLPIVDLLIGIAIVIAILKLFKKGKKK